MITTQVPAAAVEYTQQADVVSTRRRRVTQVTLAAICVLAAGAVARVWLSVDPPPYLHRGLMPVPHFRGTHLELHIPGFVAGGTAAFYADELYAYLMYDYLRHSKAFRGVRLLMTYDHHDSERPYRLMVLAGADQLAAIPSMIELETAGAVQPDSVRLVSHDLAMALGKQTELFTSAYTMPVRKKLEQLPRAAISKYLLRFIRFKSNTDPRIRLKLDGAPKPLSSEEAQHLAGDIIRIAEFYSLPIEFLVGIGAMENNYMNVRGDLTHSIWKRRAAPDDVVLERKRGRVRVLNDSAGVWQITRETLRHAHRLYQRDTRDYSRLPEHLRPPKELNVAEVSPQVLTTYAGILLRDLLDRFSGDVMLAVSAYNGGPGRPNLRYGEGANRAADHARRVMEQAAALGGESVMRRTWLRRP